MGEPLYTIKDKIIELRQLEQTANAEFILSKNKLLEIKREIKILEELLNPKLS